MTFMDQEFEILEKAFGAMPDGHCVIHVLRDENEEPVDWQFSYVNEMMVEIEGVPRELLLEKSFLEIFPNASRKWLPYYDRSAYHGETIELDEYSPEIHKYIHVISKPYQPGYAVCILRDVTRNHLKSLSVQNTKGLLYIDLDADTYETLHSQRRGEKNAGSYTADILPALSRAGAVMETGTRLDTVLQPEALKQALMECDSIEFKFKAAEDSQEPAWQLLTCVVCEREENIPHGITMSVRSIDALIYHEEQQRKLLAAACEASDHANRAKSVFLSQMSHDIRTPMNAIIGFTQLLQEHAGDRQKVEEYSEKIMRSGHHLLDIINDILDISKIESGEVVLNLSEFSLSELLEDITNITHPLALEKQQRFTIRSQLQGQERYLGDRSRIAQILLNILSNAVKFTPENGSVELKIWEREQRSRNRTCLCFEISDTGPGISQNFQKHIFTPFSQEHLYGGSEQGTGLGMAITKNLVDLMGGAISLTSTPEVGSTFTVQLELRVANSHERTDGKTQEYLQQSKEYAFRRRKFLIAEDNALNAEIVCEVLKLSGASCTVAVNGKEAAELFERSAAGTFDAILSDVQMPVMNGYEMAVAIRTGCHPQAKVIPILAMTANAFSDDVKASQEAGMDGHVSKPIDFDMLADMLSRIFNNQRR